ncbi:oligosaccharide flippase family protein [Pseudoalteromonas undina]|uniref:oligosaccharide flippase family protein n=1 Tax=Pseudoalteromonas undina TaxID=43660 RepID=UPI001867DCA0|nr:oligosaccharide flippase family protein [Pseudoalteromonas undina]
MKYFNLARNNFIYLLIVSFTQFFILVIVANALSVEENGYYILGTLISGTLANFFILGINSSNVYFKKINEYSLKILLKKNIEFLVIIGVFISAILYYVLFLYSELLFPGVPKLVVNVSLLIFYVALLNYISCSFFQALNLFHLFNLYSFSSAFLNLLLVVIFFLYGIDNYLYFLFAIFFSSLLTALAAFIHVLFLVRENFDEKSSKETKFNYHKFYAFGLKSHLSNVVAYFMSRLDMYMISFFINPASTAIYSVAVLFVERVGLVSQSLSTVMFPDLVAYKDDKDKLYPLIEKAFKVNFVLGLLICCISLIFIYPVISFLYTPSYLEALNVFYILLLGVFLKSSSRIIAISVTAMGKPEVNFYTALIVLVLNVILNIHFIPIYGILGAAIATTISYTFNLIMRLLVFRSKFFGYPIVNLIPSGSDFKDVYKLLLRRESHHDFF